MSPEVAKRTVTWEGGNWLRRHAAGIGHAAVRALGTLPEKDKGHSQLQTVSSGRLVWEFGGFGGGGFGLVSAPTTSRACRNECSRSSAQCFNQCTPLTNVSSPVLAS